MFPKWCDECKNQWTRDNSLSKRITMSVKTLLYSTDVIVPKFVSYWNSILKSCHVDGY